MEDKDLIETEGKGWYSNILNGISKAFNSFVTVFKKHGFIYSLAVFCLFALLYCLIINPINIDKIVQQRFNIEKENEKIEQEIAMEKRMQANDIINNISIKMIDKFENIHRILLLESHNSLKSLSGVDFLYFSCSFEMLTPNSRYFKYLSDDLQRQMQVNLIGNNMINTLKHRDYIHYPEIQNCKHPDHRLLHKLAEAGDTDCIIISFLNKQKYPAMLLVISGEDLPVNDIVEYVNDFIPQIEANLL